MTTKLDEARQLLEKLDSENLDAFIAHIKARLQAQEKRGLSVAPESPGSDDC